MPSAERRKTPERQPEQPKRIQQKETPTELKYEQQKTIREVFPFAIAEIADNTFVVKGPETPMVDTMDPAVAETRASAETKINGLKNDYDALLDSILTSKGVEGSHADLARTIAKNQKDSYIATAVKRKNPSEALSLILADIAETSEGDLRFELGMPNLMILEGEQALASVARDAADTKEEAAGEYASMLARAETIRAQREVIDASLGRKVDPAIRAATAEGFVEMLPAEMYAQGSEAIQAQIDRVRDDLMQITALGDLEDPMDAGRAKLLTAELKRHETAMDVLEIFDDAQTALESIKRKTEQSKDEWIANWEEQLDGVDLQIGSVSRRLEDAQQTKADLEGFIEHFEGTPEAEQEEATLEVLNNLIPELTASLSRLEQIKSTLDTADMELNFDEEQAIEAANTQLYSDLVGLAMDGNEDVVADLIEERLENQNLSSAEQQILEAALTFIDGNPWESRERQGQAALFNVGDKVYFEPSDEGATYRDEGFEIIGFTASDLAIVKHAATGKEYRFSADNLVLDERFSNIPDVNDLPPVPPVEPPPAPIVPEAPPMPAEQRILPDGVSQNASPEDAARLSEALEAPRGRYSAPPMRERGAVVEENLAEARDISPVSELERLTAEEHGMEVEDLRRIQTLFESMQVLLEAIGRPSELEELPKDWNEFLKAEKKSERGFWARLRGKEAEQDKMMGVIMEKYQLHKEEMLNIDPNADYIQMSSIDLSNAVANLEQVGSRIKVTLPGSL